MKKIKVEFTNERIIPAAGLAVVGAILGKSEFVKHCNHVDVTENCFQRQIKNWDIGSSLRSQIFAENIEMLRSIGIVPRKLPNGYVPVDINVTFFDNSKNQKQGISRTYKGYAGYAPIMAYIRTEGFLINYELCEGKQHYQKHTPEFLWEIIHLCRKVTNEPLFVRLDSGNDAAENNSILIEAGCYFIINRKSIDLRTRYWSMERSIDKYDSSCF